VSAYGQVVQIGLDFLGTQIPRVAFAVEEDELPNPVPICLLGPRAEMTTTADDRYLIEKAKRNWLVATP